MLLERVRRALAPDYEILEEIAGGGMGIVFAARQPRLDRKVALKILRPEHATAIAAERFLAEGRVLARLAHPNIVPIYAAGEADGLLYYVMEFVEGETLAARLSRGALPPAEALRLAEDLLGALAAAHALGVVHRDVKPANIFLHNGRALLGDFGIARWREKDAAGYTTPGELIGTPRYMSPEQRDGLPATARTDVYAAGLVLWEACTGARWPYYQDPKSADWSRLPPALAPAVRRALELAPEQRWEDARQFLAAIERAARRRARPGALLVAVGVLAMVIAGYWILKPPPAAPNRAALTLAILPFSASGTGVGRDLGDSAAAYIRNLLSGYPDLYVAPLGERSTDPRTIRLEGMVALSGGQLRLTVQERGGQPLGDQLVSANDSGPGEDWRRLADTVTAKLVYAIWNRAEHDPYFPVNAIPSDAGRRAQLAKAEQFFSLGQWENAQQAYRGIKGTCLLCIFRSHDIARWFGLPQDTLGLALLQRADSSFPPQYRPLIHAFTTPPPARFDTLESASRDWNWFFLAPFEFADELFHRGPLYGRLRAEAIDPFRKTLLARPRFWPGLEHLTWLLISEGDSAGAKQTLDSLQAQPAASGLAAALATLRLLGFHWRFLPPDAARQFSAALLKQPQILQYREAAAGARLLMSMDTPRGAFELGGMFARWREREDAALPGLLAQLYGAAALGWLDSLAVIRKRFARFPQAPAYELLALELEAVLRAFDPDPAVRDAGEVRQELERATRRLTADAGLHARATWMLGVLAAHRGDTATLSTARRDLRGQLSPPWLGRILDAALAGRTEPRGALALLRDAPSLDREVGYADPLEDAVVHLLRATFQEQLDSLPEALRTLRWHEHSQIEGHLTGEPQPGELAWAVGTLARWKRGELLAAMGVNDNAEWCSLNRGIARLWAGGEPVFRARAATAKHTADSAACGAAP